MSAQIDNLFNLLDDWRHLPKYQLERRADIFFALYMKEIIEHAFPGAVIERKHIIPEFPLRKGVMNDQTPDDDRSTNVDYMVFDEKHRTVYLVELKTDENSAGPGQRALLAAAAEKMPELIKGILHIATKPLLKQHKTKYEALRQKLEVLGLVKQVERTYVECCEGLSVKPIYIKPSRTWKSAADGGITVIDFEQVIEAISANEDDIAVRFRQSLKVWSGVENAPLCKLDRTITS